MQSTKMQTERCKGKKYKREKREKEKGGNVIFPFIPLCKENFKSLSPQNVIALLPIAYLLNKNNKHSNVQDSVSSKRD